MFRAGDTLDSLTMEWLQAFRPGKTWAVFAKLFARFLNYQIEKHAVTGSCDGGTTGYSGGGNSGIPIAHMNTAANLLRAHVIPLLAEDGTATIPAGCFARLVYRTDAAPATAHVLTAETDGDDDGWVALVTTAHVKTALTLALSRVAVPTASTLWMEVSVPNGENALVVACADLVRTSIPA
ncbi:MAG: hypothetical protein WC789_10690 [Lentisphaeria bacterium]